MNFYTLPRARQRLIAGGFLAAAILVAGVAVAAPGHILQEGRVRIGVAAQPDHAHRRAFLGHFREQRLVLAGFLRIGGVGEENHVPLTDLGLLQLAPACLQTGIGEDAPARAGDAPDRGNHLGAIRTDRGQFHHGMRRGVHRMHGDEVHLAQQFDGACRAGIGRRRVSRACAATCRCS